MCVLDEEQPDSLFLVLTVTFALAWACCLDLTLFWLSYQVCCSSVR